jgi:pimeloyl-ACP methyl ester carboxylesterase
MANLNATIQHQQVSKATIFYREDVFPTNPTILLLRGFPTSSHMLRNMIPILSRNYQVIAPDLPGIGFSTVDKGYSYTVANFVTTVVEFLDTLDVKK